jgi:hypothetical protein
MLTDGGGDGSLLFQLKMVGEAFKYQVWICCAAFCLERPIVVIIVLISELRRYVVLIHLSWTATECSGHKRGRSGILTSKYITRVGRRN